MKTRIYATPAVKGLIVDAPDSGVTTYDWQWLQTLHRTGTDNTHVRIIVAVILTIRTLMSTIADILCFIKGDLSPRIWYE